MHEVRTYDRYFPRELLADAEAKKYELVSLILCTTKFLLEVLNGVQSQSLVLDLSLFTLRKLQPPRHYCHSHPATAQPYHHDAAQLCMS